MVVSLSSPHVPWLAARFCRNCLAPPNGDTGGGRSRRRSYRVVPSTRSRLGRPDGYNGGAASNNLGSDHDQTVLGGQHTRRNGRGACFLAVDAEFAEKITVYKTPTCGCCAAWVDYLRDNGFQVEAHNMPTLAGIKTKHGLTDRRLMSCHTAIVDGYVVEGHVPVDDIRRLLEDRPDILGITAPGMPQLSPGMHSIIPKDYDVLSFDEQGRIELFSRY